MRVKPADARGALSNTSAMDSGLYQLAISLPGRTLLTPGRLGTFELAGGLYVYTGIARRNLRARLARHARKDKRLRWHVDYLLQYGIIKRIFIYPVETFTECELSLLILETLEGEIPIPRFGASDCRCRGHLVKCPVGKGVREMEKAVSRVGGSYSVGPEDFK